MHYIPVYLRILETYHVSNEIDIWHADYLQELISNLLTREEIMPSYLKAMHASNTYRYLPLFYGSVNRWPDCSRRDLFPVSHVIYLTTDIFRVLDKFK